MQKVINYSDIAQSFKGVIRWIDEDGSKQVWEPFEDWNYDDLDGIESNFIHSRARFVESLGIKVNWNK